jgi:glycosyltransferase involved in cell wall biosynthesis
MIIPNYFPIIGGAENQLKNLSYYLTSDNIITVLTNRYYGLKKNETIDGVYIKRRTFLNLLSFNKYINLVGLFLFLLKNHKKFDVFHFHQGVFNNAILSIISKNLFKKKIICKIANSGAKFDLNNINFLFSSIYLRKLFVNSVDVFVVLNSDIENQLRKYNPREIIHIPNGVAINSNIVEFDNFSRKIIFCSRLVPQKNINIVLNYLLAFEIDICDFDIVIYGDGSCINELVEISKNFKHLNIYFEQNVESPFLNYKFGDIFINASSYEGLSNSLLEAMSQNIVPIVSNIPGNIEVISDGFNGKVFDIDNFNQFRDMFMLVANDTHYYKFLSSNAKNSCIEKYSFNIVSDKYNRLYKKLVNENN